MRGKHIFSFLIIAIVCAVFSYPFLIQNKLPIPSDAIVALYHPYRDVFAKEYPQGYPYKNFLITDPLRQQYVWREAAMNSVKNGQIPLWNPYSASGEPLLGNIQSAAFYPLNILFFIFPFHLGWSLLILLQPLLAGIFLYLYLINLKLSKKASIIGAIAYAFCGFNVAWLEWGTIVHTGLWLPLVLLGIDKIFETSSDKKVKSKNKQIGLWSLLLLLSLSFSFFAGHLQTFFYLYLLSLSYFFVRWLQHKNPLRIVLLFFIFNICFLIVTFVQWFPMFQLISNSARDIDQIWQKDGWFIPFFHAVQFVAPDFFGNPTTQNYWGTWNYAEMVGYVGIIPLILALLALSKRGDKKTIFFGIWLVIALLFAMPTFIATVPFQLNIPFIATAQPTRLLFVINFCLSVLAAIGFDYLLMKRKKIYIPLGILLAVFLLLWVTVSFNIFNVKISPENLLVAKNNIKLPSILFLVSSVLLVSYIVSYKKKKLSTLLFLFLVILISFDLLRFSWKFNSFTDKELLHPKAKVTTFLSDKSEKYPWRFLGVDYVKDQKRIFAPNISIHDKIYTLDTYNPLLLRRYQEFAAVSEWGFVDIPDFSFNRTIILNNYDSRLIDFLGVKYIATINDIDSKKLKYLFKEGETRVYENLSVFSRAFMVYDVEIVSDKKQIAKKMYDSKIDLRKTAFVEEPLPGRLENKRSVPNKVQVLTYSDNVIKLDVETKEDGFLVLTDTFYPTWHAKVNNNEEKIYRTNYSFRGIFIKAGKHRITFYNSLL